MGALRVYLCEAMRGNMDALFFFGIFLVVHALLIGGMALCMWLLVSFWNEVVLA